MEGTSLMFARAPVTLSIALAAVCASFFLGSSPQGASVWLSWLVHTEPTHLASDVIPWLILGLWLEPRAGVARWAAWTALAVLMTSVLHGALYPAQAAVFGLSAVVHTVAFAGLISWRGGVPGDPRRWAVLLLLSVILVDELLHGASAWRALVAETGRGTRFVSIPRIETTPLLHAAAAILGGVLGLTPGLGRTRQGPQAPRALSQPAAVACR